MQVEYYVEKPPVFTARGQVAAVSFMPGSRTLTFIMPPYVFQKGCIDGANVARQLFTGLNQEAIEWFGRQR